MTLVDPAQSTDESMLALSPEMPAEVLVLDDGVTVPDLDNSRSGKKLKKVSVVGPCGIGCGSYLLSFSAHY